MSRIIAYRLARVLELEEGGIATAALMKCMATGEVLSGMGGGGEFLSPEVVQALRSAGTARAICDRHMLDALLAMAHAVALGDDQRDTAKSIMDAWPEVFS